MSKQHLIRPEDLGNPSYYHWVIETSEKYTDRSTWLRDEITKSVASFRDTGDLKDIPPALLAFMVSAIDKTLTENKPLRTTLGLKNKTGPKSKRSYDDEDIAMYFHMRKKEHGYDHAVAQTIKRFNLPNNSKSERRIKQIYDDAKGGPVYGKGKVFPDTILGRLKASRWNFKAGTHAYLDVLCQLNPEEGWDQSIYPPQCSPIPVIFPKR